MIVDDVAIGRHHLRVNVFHAARRDQGVHAAEAFHRVSRPGGEEVVVELADDGAAFIAGRAQPVLRSHPGSCPKDVWRPA